MTPEELHGELRSGRLRPAYLLAGEEPLLRDDAIAAIRGAVLGGGPADFNLDRLDGDAVGPAHVTDAVRTLPVMAERRLVLLREPVEKRAAARGLLDALAEAVRELRKGEPRTVLVVTAARPDRKLRWVRAFSQPAAVVACDPPKGVPAAAAFAREEARRQEIELEPGAAELLAERSGPQLLLLRQEVAKLALLVGPGGRVATRHVLESTSDLAEEPIWDLTDAIGNGRAGAALGVLDRMLDGGATPVAILGALAQHFRRLARAATGGRIAGHPFAVRKLETQARRYRPDRLVACLRAIQEVDEVLKGRGNIPPHIALERLVLGLSA